MAGNMKIQPATRVQKENNPLKTKPHMVHVMK